MQAIAIVNQQLQLSEFASPRPEPWQVLIKVKAAGVNRPDLMQREGLYPPPAGASAILGLEVAGVVVAVGSEASRFKIGTAVCALLPGGGYSEYCLASACCCLPIPNGFSWIQAAAIPETFFTVWSNLVDRGGLRSGDSVLIHGGGSGIGTTAIQIGKALGAKVYVTAGSEEKCQQCLSLGADAAINYRETDFVAAIAEISQGQGVNQILDMIGGDYLGRNLKCLAEQGQLLQIGIQNGSKAEINLWPVMAKRLIITGSTLRARNDDFKAAIAQQLLHRVWPWLESGQILPVIDTVFPLAQAEQAHLRLKSGAHFGKIILEI